MPAEKLSKKQVEAPTKPITLISPPDQGSPMDKFNKAAQKILSVPKRIVKKK